MPCWYKIFLLLIFEFRIGQIPTFSFLGLLSFNLVEFFTGKAQNIHDLVGEVQKLIPCSLEKISNFWENIWNLGILYKIQSFQWFKRFFYIYSQRRKMTKFKTFLLKSNEKIFHGLLAWWDAIDSRENFWGIQNGHKLVFLPEKY